MFTISVQSLWSVLGDCCSDSFQLVFAVIGGYADSEALSATQTNGAVFV
jgi:hypothetical protein